VEHPFHLTLFNKYLMIAEFGILGRYFHKRFLTKSLSARDKSPFSPQGTELLHSKANSSFGPTALNARTLNVFRLWVTFWETLKASWRKQFSMTSSIV
jgi:hypothetical protein